MRARLPAAWGLALLSVLLLAPAAAPAQLVLPASVAASRPQLADAPPPAELRRRVLGQGGRVGAMRDDGWNPLADTAMSGPALPAPHYRVDRAQADGRIVFATIQGAVAQAHDDLRSGRQRAPRVVIAIEPGDYEERVHVPAGPVPFTLVGDADDPRRVRLHAALHAQMRGSELRQRFGAVFAAPGQPGQAAAAFEACAARETIGTFCTAVLSVHNDGFQLRGITVENTHGGGAPGNQQQAVALALQADRVHLSQVRLLSHQDTLLMHSAEPDTVARVFVHRSLVAGDVDFVFGRATAYFLASELRWNGALRGQAGGYVAAPSTALGVPYGFVFEDCDFTASPGAPTTPVKLARQWFEGAPCSPYGERRTGCALHRPSVLAVGKVWVLRSRLGEHLDARRPWADWNTDPGHRAYRRVQWNAEDFRGRLREAGHALQEGELAPSTPFLAEYRNTGPSSAGGDAIERGVLAEFDGWASAEGGVRGGAMAAPAQVFDVRDRRQLRAALAPLPGLPADTPRIVRVHGTIDLSADDRGRPLGPQDFRDPQFDLAAYASAFDPATWGRRPPAGPLEDARRRSQQRQAAHVVMRVPSHTTIVGVGGDARIVRGMLLLQDVEQVILRHLAFEDAFDHFPAWDPDDNGHGEWNAEYDNVSLRNARHVWIDHCRFSDGERADHQAGSALGRPLQHHDGLLDITHGSDLVTVSWSHFHDHDKSLLIGGSDARRSDAGRLRVTLHHNRFEGLGQRAPRVRYGQVHVYNNLYQPRAAEPSAHAYSIGAGLESSLRVEANAWDGDGLAPGSLLSVKGGERLAERGNVLNGAPVGLQAAWRDAAPGRPALQPLDPSTTPPHGRIDPAGEAADRIRTNAGPGVH